MPDIHLIGLLVPDMHLAGLLAPDIHTYRWPGSTSPSPYTYSWLDQCQMWWPPNALLRIGLIVFPAFSAIVNSVMELSRNASATKWIVNCLTIFSPTGQNCQHAFKNQCLNHICCNHCKDYKTALIKVWIVEI